MDLRTTTYAGRHRRLLEDLAALAPVGRLRILEVGPGLAVRGLGRLASRGVPGRPVFKGFETLARRLPLPDRAYENYETEELLGAFGRDRVDLTILDINPRSLAVIAGNLAPYRVSTVAADLADPALPQRPELAGRFDVVVALATVGRIPPDRRVAAAENLVRLTTPGGLVAEDTGRLEAGSTLAATGCEHVFRRLGEGGGATYNGVVLLAITGRVQGVGYRVWLRDAAIAAGVAGWTRNRRDGAVEAMLAGDPDAVQALVELCRTGPPGASVASIVTAVASDPAPIGFAILRDD